MEKFKTFLEKLPPWTFSIICFLAICWLTLSPDPLGDNELPLFPGADKIAHAIMFGGFTFCIILDWNRRHDWPLKIEKADVHAADIASIFGIITELLQDAMHTGRSLEFWDMVADITGAFLVLAIVALYKFKLKDRYLH
ncbi:MAG: VanZ family protein [Muribaculaceae bacterium]|nr:VanZ family protein [Muribaculaceae bacterium]